MNATMDATVIITSALNPRELCFNEPKLLEALGAITMNSIFRTYLLRTLALCVEYNDWFTIPQLYLKWKAVKWAV